ncbi:MAG: MFS transporter [Halioglobus sp.]|nr:MFS transporter [Halioglobus sp.]
MESDKRGQGLAAGPATRREVLAWAFFDFANSGYTTVVLTAVYSAYFVAVVAAGLDARSPGSATLAWTLAIALANLIVLLSGPVIGAIADSRARKKSFLLMSSVLCIAGTALLGFTGPETFAAAVVLVVVSAVAFASGENLIAAFLPEIARSEDMGRISGFGWSLGYFGGLLTLGACLAYIGWAENRGLPATHYVPVTLWLTAAIFAATALPTFLWLRERALPQPAHAGLFYLRAGFQRVGRTLRHAAQMPDLFRFLWSLMLFQAGVATVVVVAAIYAQDVMGFSSQQLILLIMLVNLTAAAGAFLFGYAQDHFGSVPSLFAALLVWIVAIATAFGADAASDVWVAGNLIGAAMGATQAGGRALIGRLTPPARNAEIFGLWGLANRAAAIIGPISYGLISRFSGGDHQMALLSTLGFFLAGAALLLGVDEQRGMAAAHTVQP